MKLPQLTPTLQFRFVIQPVLARMQASRFSIEPQNHGETVCNFKNGQMKSTYPDKDSYGPPGCLYKHEQGHREHDEACCARASKCFNKTTGDACSIAYETWFQANIDHNECAAYTAEVSCLENAIARPSSWTKSELGELRTRLSEATTAKAYHCGRAGRLTACPFNSNGDII